MKAVIITDHAAYRYAERVLGFDLEAAKRAMRQEVGDRLDRAAAMGAKRVKIGSVSSVLEGRKLVTVIDNLEAAQHGGHRERAAQFSSGEQEEA